MTELRPYQQKLLQEVLSYLETTDKRVMMQLPTGGGKTVIAACLLRDYLVGGRKAVWITHRRELMSQTLERLREAADINASAPNWPTNEVAPHQRNGVVILMAQTAGKRSDESYIPEDWLSYIWSQYGSNDLMIVDEAHHATAPSWERAICQWPGKVMGMTATPWRLSKEGFDHLFGKLVPGPQVSDLQKDGFLCQANVLVPDSEGRILGGKIGSTGDYTETGIKAANSNRDVMTARALKFWQENAENRQTIIYAVSKGHARNLTSLFNEAGVSAKSILSGMNDEERAIAIKGFKSGELTVLVNVAIATEGFDVPDASCVVIARPTKSLSLYLQMVGRGLRKKPDGGHCLILDLAWNAWEHGLPEDRREWFLEARGESEGGGDAPVVTCDECRTVSPAASHNCKSCGAPFGKECPRCVKWRAFSTWSLNGKCGYDHEQVCNLCHGDAHQRADLPRIPPIYAFEYNRQGTASSKAKLFAFEDFEMLDQAFLCALETVDGEGKIRDVIRETATILYEIEGRRYGMVTRREDLDTRGLDSLNAYELFTFALSKCIELQSSEGHIPKEIWRQLLIRRYCLANFSNTDVSSTIRKAYRHLEKAGFCDRPRRGIWRLTESGREMGDNILLQTPAGDE